MKGNEEVTMDRKRPHKSPGGNVEQTSEKSGVIFRLTHNLVPGKEGSNVRKGGGKRRGLKVWGEDVKGEKNQMGN